MARKQVNYSIRLPKALHALLMNEAKRQGVKPSVLARRQIGKLAVESARPVETGQRAAR